MARRHNGEGSIYPYRNGFAAYVWIVTPDGRRQRKYVYGKSRQAVHSKWLAMTAASRRGPVAPTHPRLSEYLERWLNESVRPNLALAALIVHLWGGPHKKSDQTRIDIAEG